MPDPCLEIDFLVGSVNWSVSDEDGLSRIVCLVMDPVVPHARESVISETPVIGSRGDEPLHLVRHPVSSENNLALLVGKFCELFGDHIVSALGLKNLIPFQVLDPVTEELDVRLFDGSPVQSVSDKVERFLVQWLFNDRGV